MSTHETATHQLRDHLLAAFAAQGADPLVAIGFVSEHVRIGRILSSDDAFASAAGVFAGDVPDQLATLSAACADAFPHVALRSANYRPVFVARTEREHPVSADRVQALRHELGF